MAIEAITARQRRPDSHHLDEVHRLLRFVAGGGVPSRETAVDYLNHRSALLASSISAMLPGFLYQCGTIDRFKEFIFLYDPDPVLRGEFVDRMIDRARTITRSDATETPAPPASTQPNIWDF